MTAYLVTTRYPDGSQTMVIVESYWRACALSENARPEEAVTVHPKEAT
jgi:hypothetical protein